MTSNTALVLKHIALIIVVTVLIVLAIVYPFLPGEYDVLALPFSFMVQMLGVVGLPLMLPGLLWLVMPKRAFILAVVSMIFATFAIIVIALIATLSVGKIMGLLTLLAWLVCLVVIFPGIKSLRDPSPEFNPAPLYLVALPVLTLATQLILARPVTNWSRDHAIFTASQYIEDIERYHATHGSYPVTLHAQHKDYQTDVVGVEKYFYAAQGDTYNLSFEQPRFLLDRFGTREWVVYNPHDDNRMYSHVTWLLPAAGSESSQGWYESGQTRHDHWKWFHFD